MKRIYVVAALAFILGIAVGAGGTWAIGISNNPQVEIVEGYTTAVNQDDEALCMIEEELCKESKVRRTKWEQS